MNDSNLYADLGINPLTAEQREAAYAAARLKIAGEEPVPEQFNAFAFTKYPAETVRLINRFTNVVMVAAFLPSAFRIGIAGYDAAKLSFPNAEPIAILIGACSVLFAEAGQIAFTLAAAKTDGWKSRWSLYAAAGACTIFALVGNGHVAVPWEHASAFAWFEAFMPPILALVGANVRKSEIMHAIEARASARRAFEAAHASWKTAFNTSHEQGSWDRTVATLLRDALIQANKRSPAKLRALTGSDWNALVRAERKAEEWYIVDEPAPVVKAAPKRVALPVPVVTQVEEETHEVPAVRVPAASGRSSTPATGAITNALLTQTETGWVKTCAVCGFQTQPYANPRSATNALVAHQKSHSNAIANGVA